MADVKKAWQALAFGLVGVLALNVMMTLTITSAVSGMMTTAVVGSTSTTSDECQSSSSYGDGGSSTTDTSFSVSDNAMKIAQGFADAGYSKAATAGVLGNIQAESGFRPTAASADGGYGIAQWTPRSKIRAWFDANGLAGTDDSDLDGQIKMLIGTAESSFNNYYLENAAAEITIRNNSLYETWLYASDPETAAVAWMAGWERPNWALRHEDVRRQTAKNYYENGLNGLTFDTSRRDDGTSSDGGGSTTVACSTDTSDGGSASYGKVGGAPTENGNFGWMCSGNQKICGASDAGVFYPHLEYGHQCVWYAWNRLAMIHGNDGWSWVIGNGGDIANNLKGKSGWTVDGSPKAGDGISGRGTPFSDGGGCGHVAVVEEVAEDSSGWKIRISEGNRDGSASFESYGSRWLTKAQLSGTDCQFFRNSGWKS